MGCQSKQKQTEKVKPRETLKNLHITSTKDKKWELDVSSVYLLDNIYDLNHISLQSKQTKLSAEHGTSKELKEFKLFDIKGLHKKTTLKMKQGDFLSKENLLKGKDVYLKSQFWELKAESVSSYSPLDKLKLKHVKGTYKR